MMHLLFVSVSKLSILIFWISKFSNNIDFNIHGYHIVITVAVRDLNVIHVTYKRMHIGSTGSRLSNLNVEYSQENTYHIEYIHEDSLASNA